MPISTEPAIAGLARKSRSPSRTLCVPDAATAFATLTTPTRRALVSSLNSGGAGSGGSAGSGFGGSGFGGSALAGVGALAALALAGTILEEL